MIDLSGRGVDDGDALGREKPARGEHCARPVAAAGQRVGVAVGVLAAMFRNFRIGRL